jgi:hypothetical protein
MNTIKFIPMLYFSKMKNINTARKCFVKIKLDDESMQLDTSGEAFMQTVSARLTQK